MTVRMTRLALLMMGCISDMVKVLSGRSGGADKVVVGSRLRAGPVDHSREQPPFGAKRAQSLLVEWTALVAFDALDAVLPLLRLRWLVDERRGNERTTRRIVAHDASADVEHR